MDKPNIKNSDLEGEYKGKIKKDFVLPNSYRNPRVNLMVAHGIALGLYSSNSKMPMEYKKEWEARGYTVMSPRKNKFSKGDKVVVERESKFSKNNLEKLLEERKTESKLIQVRNFKEQKKQLNSESKDDVENLINDTDDEVLLEYYYDLWNIFSHTFELTVNDNELRKLIQDSISHGNNESIESLLLAKFDYKYKITNSSHIRVDYDVNVKSHHKCEIQIGSVNYIRFPLQKLISPFLFFEFIFKNIYADDFVKIRKKADYKTKQAITKKRSFDISDFIEENIYIIHD